MGWTERGTFGLYKEKFSVRGDPTSRLTEGRIFSKSLIYLVLTDGRQHSMGTNTMGIRGSISSGCETHSGGRESFVQGGLSFLNHKCGTRGKKDSLACKISQYYSPRC